MEQTFETNILHTLRQKNLVQAGHTVIVAASGGADSMALLQFFLLHRQQLGIALQAVHVDHRLRQDSAQVAQKVQRFCDANGILLHRFVADAPIAHRSEDWSRRLRYRFFETLVGDGVRIATAHTLCDQAETLLFRLARGTGVQGAGGIRPQRGAYIRPMLHTTKQQAEAYCRLHKIQWFVDPDNFSNDYARTKIRHIVLPTLAEIAPTAQQQMQRFCEQMQQTQQYLTLQGEQLLQQAKCQQGYRLATLAAAHPVQAQQALCLLVQTVRSVQQSDFAAFERLLNGRQGALQLSDGVCLKRQGAYLCLQQILPPPQPLAPQPLMQGVHHLAGGYTLQVHIWGAKEYEETIKFTKSQEKVLKYCADYDKILDSVVLRTRQAGDCYCMAGRNRHKTLKKLYNELAIPPAQRSLLPLVATGNTVVWLWGLGFAHGLRPTAQTKKVLCIAPLSQKDSPNTAPKTEELAWINTRTS